MPETAAAASGLPGPLSGSLSGVRVVAFEQAVAAPLCTRHLADLGADVIKVERQGTGDFARAYDHVVHGNSAHLTWLNRGKRSVALDLGQADGRRFARRLAQSADVVVSNLGPGVFTHRIVPAGELPASVILCEISGYAHDGPWAERKAYDLLVQGELGVTMATGTPEAPAKPAISIADLAGGMYALSSVLAALRRREHDGRGAHLHVALSEAVAEWMSPFLLTAKYGGYEAPRTGLRHSSIAPYGAFGTADGSLVNIAVQNHGQWQRLCVTVLQRPDLITDPRFADNAARFGNRDQVDQVVADILGRLPARTVQARLDQADVPWGMVNPIRSALNHPDVSAPQRWRQVRLPVGGAAEVLAGPFAVADGLEVPSVGQHTAEVLRELGQNPWQLP
jgi:itaconate CoA-transferase